MPYKEALVERVRKRLSTINKKIIEKKMFGGLAFIVDGKMCINVSGQHLMCRFDPQLQEEVQKKKGFLPMIMKGKTYKGYCYVKSSGYDSNIEFEYWIDLCLAFNAKAKPSPKR